ncbi:MAG TPA: NADH-quinone oxidoreductase subunit NuoE [Anaerolineae bacterium]
MLSDKAKSQVRSLMEKYPAPRSAIMPALHLAQRECGWLPDEAVQDLSELLGLSTTEINSVATFYTMYAREKRGEHTVYFCTDLPCALRGADELMEHIEHKLDCKAGETTANGKVTLKDAECLGGCDHAPVMLIDGEEHAQDLTPESVDQILDRLMK